MSRFRVLGTVTALVIAGCVAAAQTPSSGAFQTATKVIPEGQLIGVSNTHSLTSSSLFNGDQRTGTWGPDNRYIDPLFSLDMGTQTLLLGPFGGTNLNGDGPLFLADLDFGAQGTMAKWGVIVTAIPEPSAWALMGLGGIAFGMRFMRRRVFCWRLV
jgi:hypothetical protein